MVLGCWGCWGSLVLGLGLRGLGFGGLSLEKCGGMA